MRNIIIPKENIVTGIIDYDGNYNILIYGLILLSILGITVWLLENYNEKGGQ